MRRAACLAVAAVSLAGCGAERTPVLDVHRPQRPFGLEVLRFPRAGLTLQLPRGWQRTTGRPPLVVSASSGPVTVAVWRYPRREPLPATEAALTDARRALLAAARARDPTLQVTASRVRRIAGRPAVDVLAVATIDGRPRIVRSVHAYAFGAELVIDAYGPSRDAARLQREVVAPLLAGLEIRRP